MIGVRRLTMLIVSVAVLTTLGLFAGASSALAGSVWWGLTSGSWPTHLAPGGTGRIVVSAENLGDAVAEGQNGTIVLRDTLPAGLTVLEHLGKPELEGHAGEVLEPGGHHYRGPVECALDGPREVQCAFTGELPSYEEIEVRILVKVSALVAPQEANTVQITGAGSQKSLTRALDISEEPAGFGIEDYEMQPEEEGGQPTLQAGAHPFQLTSVLAFDTADLAAEPEEQQPAGMPKNEVFDLPAGFVGNPTPFPQCTYAQFTTQEPGIDHDECTAQAAVGTATVTADTPNGGRVDTRTVPLFNLTPLRGEPARFGFEVKGFRVALDTAVRTGTDYGVTVSVQNITQTPGLLLSKVTFWGVPGDPRHDAARGWDCLEEATGCASVDENEPPPLLSLPTVCGVPLRTSTEAYSWAEPKAEPARAEYTMGTLDGCNHLSFDPSIAVAPETLDASTATGLEVQVHVPQTAMLNPEGLAESAVRNTTVALPVGVAVNPGEANGLQTCAESEIGYLGSEAGEPEQLLFTPELASPFCPNAAKIGTVEIETPLLGHPLKGAAYLAAQTGNPFSSLIALYLVASDPVSGVLVKLAGEVALNESTGQLVTTFKDTPELPFENLRLRFFGEPGAPLGTPPLCGEYTTAASFTPWSGNEPAPANASFVIDAGPHGRACPSGLPFAPVVSLGTANNQAGAFSPLVASFSREDGSQTLAGLSVHLPPGLAGTLAGVTLCGEAQANAGTCGPGSLIGELSATVGLGEKPYVVTGGKVYLTGPYEGAPFGLSVVVPTTAGPFTLQGNAGFGRQVARAKIEVDPETATLMVRTNASGLYAIPHILDGVPLQIKEVDVLANRPDFTFNPTNCAPMRINGLATSSEGTTASLSVPFQATNCAVLAFAPKFTVATSAHTSRLGGASLHVRLSYPSTPAGTQANLAKVKVELPKRLPSRLTTLRKACLAAQFSADPAACPPASIVGHAKATTPILPVPLEGPAYFVSHGGEAFPSLVIVLQGYGVTVDVTGTTFINKHGITSSAFQSVPDLPVGTFELTLPEGRYSALTAIGSLCKGKLEMPTRLIAQNGMEINRSTQVAVAGCPKAKKVKGKHKRGGRTGRAERRNGMRRSTRAARGRGR